MRTFSRFALSLLALAAASTGAVAQGFYAGKKLTILVNYDPGGPTDIEARVFARHIGKHVAGSPTIVVQNMGGAAGLVGTKYLGEALTVEALEVMARTVGYGTPVTVAVPAYWSEGQYAALRAEFFAQPTLAPSGVPPA